MEMPPASAVSGFQGLLSQQTMAVSPASTSIPIHMRGARRLQHSRSTLPRATEDSRVAYDTPDEILDEKNPSRVLLASARYNLFGQLHRLGVHYSLDVRFTNEFEDPMAHPRGEVELAFRSEDHRDIAAEQHGGEIARLCGTE